MLLAPRRPRRRDTGWDLAVDMLVLAALDAEYNERVNQVRRTLSIATRVSFPLLSEWAHGQEMGEFLGYAGIASLVRRRASPASLAASYRLYLVFIG